MLAHLNLVGDGDEIAAIEAVEREFGIRIDTSDAGMWFNVGDVYAALLRSLPGGADQPPVWERFCAALATESDDDPAHIAKSTRLLMP